MGHGPEMTDDEQRRRRVRLDRRIQIPYGAAVLDGIRALNAVRPPPAIAR